MENHSVKCPMCEEGQLFPQVSLETVTYQGHTVTVNYDSTTCSLCGSNIVTPSQAKVNQARVLDEYRKRSGLLTGQELQQIREQFHLTIAQAASLFGSEMKAFGQYEQGEALQSVTLDKLLRLVSQMPLAFEQLQWLAGMKIKPMESSR